MNELLKPFAEIRTDHTDEDNFTHIDGFTTEDDNEEGQTLAVVCRDTGKVVYFDNLFRVHPQVQEAIKLVVDEIETSKLATGLQEGECAVPIANDQFLVFPSAEKNPEGCDYVRFVDEDGEELKYWHSDEWRDDPELVMGAIMACIQHGAE